jgi:hypothetical protein
MFHFYTMKKYVFKWCEMRLLGYKNDNFKLVANYVINNYLRKLYIFHYFKIKDIMPFFIACKNKSNQIFSIIFTASKNQLNLTLQMPLWFPSL